MLTESYLIHLAILLLLSGVFFLILRQRNMRLHAYKKALETAQRHMDNQNSRINILTNSLPNLLRVIQNPQLDDTWKSLCLDDARALLWADGSCYWRYHERGQDLDLEISKGVQQHYLDDTLRQCLKLRIPSLSKNDNPGQKKSSVAIPLVISGNLLGVFQFFRSLDEPFTQPEADLAAMFINQVGLALENKEMVTNQEKYYLELVQSLADVLDSRDSTTQSNTRTARGLARATSEKLDMPAQFTYYLEFAALLHDIGKIAIDDHLLKKPGKLTPEEFAIVKSHPELGYKILEPVTMLAPVAPMVLYHQEWFNGKGYPEGLKGEEIPLGARIVGVLDAWMAMRSEHPWKKAMPVKDAIDQIKKGSGTQFDPRVVDAFLSVVERQRIAA